LKQNWDLISLPFNESINKLDIVVSHGGTNYSWTSAVANNIVLNFIYGWNTTNQNYDDSDTLEPGKGYWIWSYHDDVDLLLSSDAVGDGYITLLKQRWNIMGLPDDDTVQKEDLVVHYNVTDYSWYEATTNNNEKGEPLILGFIYGWDVYTQNYILSDYLDPGYGYWMYAYYNCTLLRSL
jgi:hypothetical protein